MIEKLVERWLDNANERVFQFPFALALACQGHKVIHLTRHCGMELGKDILTIDPDGNPCAYQLKGTDNGKLSLSKWRLDVQPQLIDLVLGSIQHPGIDAKKKHRSFLVVNGNLEEEVQRAIVDFNLAREKDGTNTKLEVIVKGQIFGMINDLGKKFWPQEPNLLQPFLEIFIDKGDGQVPKEKFSQFVNSLFFINNEQSKKITKRELELILIGSVITCLIAINNFREKENYAAELELLTIICSEIFYFVEKNNVDEIIWRPIVELIMQSIKNALVNICEELKTTKQLVVGSPMTDFSVYRIRVTYLLSLMSIYGLWIRNEPDNNDEEFQFLRDFFTKNINNIELWGEAASPQFIAIYLFYRQIDATIKTDYFLLNVIKTIINSQLHPLKAYLNPPYYDVEEVLEKRYRLNKYEIEDNPRMTSYSLESILHLFIRRNLKQEVRWIWPDVSRIAIQRFIPNQKYDLYKWRCDEGVNMSEMPNPTQYWQGLRDVSIESEGEYLPPRIKEYPFLYLLWIITYPHRMESSGSRWIATQLR